MTNNGLGGDKLFSPPFWRATLELGGRAFVSALLVALPLDSEVFKHLHTIDFKDALLTAAGTALVMMLGSVTTINVGPKNSPLVSELGNECPAPAAHTDRDEPPPQ